MTRAEHPVPCSTRGCPRRHRTTQPAADLWTCPQHLRDRDPSCIAGAPRLAAARLTP